MFEHLICASTPIATLIIMVGRVIVGLTLQFGDLGDWYSYKLELPSILIPKTIYALGTVVDLAVSNCLKFSVCDIQRRNGRNKGWKAKWNQGMRWGGGSLHVHVMKSVLANKTYGRPPENALPP